MVSPVITSADFDAQWTPEVGFGFTNESISRALRKLADVMDAGAAQPERVILTHRMLRDEFHATTLVLTYSELDPNV